MPANSDPIFTKNGKFGSALVTGSNPGTDGNTANVIGTNVFLAFTADATNGSFVQRVRWIATGSANNIATAATVGRVWISSTSSGSTSTSTAFLISEVVLPSVTAAASASVAPYIDVPIGFPVPAGYSVLVGNANTPNAGTAWRADVIAGDY